MKLLKGWKTDGNDTLASFDVVSLFTKILIDEAVDIVRNVSNDEIDTLVEICLRLTYFTLRGEIYE